MNITREGCVFYRLSKTLACLSLTGLSLTAIAGEISPHLQSLIQKKQQPRDIMVYMKERADIGFASSLVDRQAKLQFVHQQLVSQAETTQAGLLSFLKARGLKAKSFHIENVVQVQNADSKLISELASRTDVRRVALDAKIPMNLPANPSKEGRITVTEPLRMVSAPRVWQELGVRGEGIVVAGQDTGVLWDHESLKRQYRGVGEDGNLITHDYNWHEAIHSSSGVCGSSSATPCDDHSHGTHTIGNIVGDNGRGVVTGVAPKSKWIACRNMDKGVGTVSTYLECFEFFMSPYPVGGNARENGDTSQAPHIINNSWSCPRKEGCDGEEFVDTIRALNAAGILTVVSAGNDGPGCESVANPPGMYSGL
ncbi:MAG: S8 family serine peptidase, partial [Bdellovibrionales bacterium]|nr:S8 family serine peptidase [Bdellovibrionales bacterium]